MESKYIAVQLGPVMRDKCTLEFAGLFIGGRPVLA